MTKGGRGESLPLFIGNEGGMGEVVVKLSFSDFSLNDCTEFWSICICKVGMDMVNH